MSQNNIKNDINNITDALNRRYATKSFDANKKLSREQCNTIKEVLRLTPTAYGLQPYKFFIISNREIKENLKAHSRNQAQITDCSHLVVFTTPNELNNEYIDFVLKNRAECVKRDNEKKEDYKQRILNGLEWRSPEQMLARMQKQAYIALGNLLTACAILEIDTCPIEGMIAEKYDEILHLQEKGVKTCVVCAIGFRKEDDGYQKLPKFRLSQKDLIEEIE